MGSTSLSRTEIVKCGLVVLGCRYDLPLIPEEAVDVVDIGGVGDDFECKF